MARHEHTKATPDGSAEREAKKTNRRAKPLQHLPHTPTPKWATAHPNAKQSPLKPHHALALELRLARTLDKMRTRLEQAARNAGLKRALRPLSFERWRFAARWAEQGSHPKPLGHPVLPGATRPAAAAAAAAGELTAAGRELSDDLRLQGLLLSDANHVVRELEALSAASAKAELQTRDKARSGKAMEPPPVDVEFHRHTVDLTCGPRFVKLTHAAYARLAILHRRALPAEAPPRPAAAEGEGEARALAEIEAELASAKADVGAEAVSDVRRLLHVRMFTLLLRYKSLRGHGFQAAVGPAVWRVIMGRLGVGFECCASPLNCYLPAYCSGFPDVDAPFGTCGSFFALKISSGSYAINPPFVRCLLDASAKRVVELLRAAAAAEVSHALSFVFFMPGWKETEAFATLAQSQFLRRSFVVAARDHGFCDGAAHQRQDPFRESPYDTIVSVLQTERAANKWPADDELEAELRAALAESMPLASASERQKTRRASKMKRAHGTAAKPERRAKRPATFGDGEASATAPAEKKKRVRVVRGVPVDEP